MVIFSTTRNEVIFSAHFWESDELSSEDASRFVREFKPSHPYFVAGSGIDVLVEEIFPAWRSLSKMYFDDFNNDLKHDIVLWRKVYTSKLRSEAEPGFDKVGEKLVHYSLKDGKYQLESTSSEVIKGWLATKELTWQKGYPSKSECAGQEGQLIPEMHDPLLNDPEVLM
jgi:hypothetical protein